MTNIHDLVNLLSAIRIDYQMTHDRAMETKEKELEVLNRDYVPNSPTYSQKQKEIEMKCEATIINARKVSAKQASEEIEDLRQWELSRVGRIDETTVNRINALRNIPLTTAELQEVLAKNGRSNYWVQKAVGALAEENGIPVTELPLDASLDTKLSMLNGLEQQLDKLLKFYGEKGFIMGADNEPMKARFLYLNDDVLNNVVNIYNNGVQELSEMDAAEMAYYKIRAMSGQMQKAVAISNSLRNLKKQDAKNMLLYRLATDDSIRAEAYQVAGIADEMAEWKGGGKAERYVRAIKLMDKLKTTQDTEKIESTLRDYAERVEMGSEQVNEFVRGQITKAYKKNSFIGKALDRLTDTEKNWLFGDTGQENTVKGIDLTFENTAEPESGSVTE